MFHAETLSRGDAETDHEVDYCAERSCIFIPTVSYLLEGMSCHCGEVPSRGWAMRKNADFFISAASEMRGDLATIRACWAKWRLQNDVRDDHMPIEIDPR